MSALLALAAALAFGTADFLAGMASRRAHFALVGLSSQLVGTVVVAVALVLTDHSVPELAQMGRGALAGSGSALGILTLYRGLARGKMGVVGCVSAVCAASLPAAVGIVEGDRLSMIAIAGLMLGLPGVWLVSKEQADGAWRWQSVRDGMVAGLGFAIMFVALGSSQGDGGSLWPVLVSQAVGSCLSAVYVLSTGIWRSRHTMRPPAARSLGIGLLNAAGVVGFHQSSALGSLSISSLLSAMYPAVTLGLATAVLGERLEPWQRTGLALSAVAIVLITLGSS